MTTIKYINPLWDRRDKYAFSISQFQTYTGSIVKEDLAEIHLQSEKFVHVLQKVSVVSIDDKLVTFDVPKNAKIRVEGSKGDLYDVERVNGIVRCSCPAFKFRKKCKHMEALAA